jgi:hypothetical protein
MARLHNPDMSSTTAFPHAVGAPWKARPTTQEVFGKTPPPQAGQDFLEREFLERVVLPNGTFKTTNANRMDDVNAAILPHIAEIADRPLKLMDVSISSGVSTLEWHDFLAEKEIPCEMVGTDLTIYASLLSLTPRLAVLVDRDRNILHLDAFGRGSPPTANGLRGLAAAIIRLMFRAAMIVDRGLPPLEGKIGAAAQGRLLRCEPVTLLTRDLWQHRTISVLEEDLLEAERPEFRNAFHVVRAANILNRGYFSNKVLVQIAGKLKARLKPDGLFLVCRTEHDGTNNATLFQSNPKLGLRPLCRVGSGSEIEDLLIGI